MTSILNNPLVSAALHTEIRPGVPRLMPVPVQYEAENLGSLELEQIIQLLNRCGSIEEFVSQTASLLRTVDLDLFAHHGITPAEAIEPVGNFPEAYFDRYAKEGFHRDDMVLLHARKEKINDCHVIFQRDLEDFIASSPFQNDIFDHNVEVCKLMRRFGVYNSCAIVIASDGPMRRFIFRVAAKNIAEDVRALVSSNIDGLRRLALGMDYVGWRKFKKYFHNPKCAKRLRIPPRPLKLIEYLAKDITLNDAADLLAISISTANQHIAAAKKSLGAQTIHGLVIAAKADGLF